VTKVEVDDASSQMEVHNVVYILVCCDVKEEAGKKKY
jgi:hypothetical protein